MEKALEIAQGMEMAEHNMKTMKKDALTTPTVFHLSTNPTQSRVLATDVAKVTAAKKNVVLRRPSATSVVNTYRATSPWYSGQRRPSHRSQIADGVQRNKVDGDTGRDTHQS